MTQVKPAVFIINSLEGGGAERVMCKLLTILESWYAEQQQKVYLLLLDDTEEAHHCPGYVIKETLASGGSLIRGYTLLHQRLKKLQPEYCVSFLTRANILNAVLGKTLSYRSILSERVNTSSHLSGGWRDKISKQLVKTTYPLADRVIAVSAGVKADLVRNFGLASGNIHIVYNPYDIAEIEDLAAQPVQDLPTVPYIIGSGRLVENKNFSLMLKAYARADIEEHLVILGQGELHAQLQTLTNQLGIAERVHFLGFKANPYPYLRGASYFVSTSNAEGFPNAIVEAMCLGKPVLATNCESGPAEILCGDYPVTVSGFNAAAHGGLCELGSVEGVATGMQYMSDDTNNQLYGYRSIARARDFSYRVFKDKILRALNRSQPHEDNTRVSTG
ncbi:glycosyltransferase [Alteromonas sp. ASW11-19]|uniref:Glycosyltransferase n=1 Tax=Alteromonas salexigens TaxID=2982530 RepID=A0ABT2VS15_9ALTE|nr:glycosyltransferase [Alteromonas salexigens]MCU7556115.1 glycosyltransferase [Alteromonas salexigens]